MNFPKYPYQPFDEPIPPPLADRGAVCFAVDAKWRPYLVGLLKTLLVDQTWESSINQAIGEASQLLEEILTADFCIVQQPGIESEECMGCCLRWQDGVLQVFSCGDWVDVPGTPGGVPGPGGSTLPPSGGQPGAGECREYNLLLNANMATILPIQVSTGDTVQVSNFKGAWSDAFPDPFTAIWYCTNGAVYALGLCSGSQHTEGGDPLPTAPHMGLIAEVGGIGTFLDFSLDGVIQGIPAGVTDENLTFIPNDSTPADNLGGVSFHVKVCKGDAAPILLTYPGSGSGPGSVPDGGTFVVSSTVSGGENPAHVHFGECVKLEVLSVSSYLGFVGGSGCYRWDWFDCASGHTVHTCDETTATPADFVPGTQATEIGATSQNPWSMVLKVTRP